MSDPSHDAAAAYWSKRALTAHKVFQEALEALAEQNPAVAAITLDDMISNEGPFVMRPASTVGAYPGPIEALVELCYRSAFGFQSAITLIHGVAPQTLAHLECDLASGSGGGPLAKAADGFFRRAIG